jgi:hypothetical protein
MIRSPDVQGWWRRYAGRSRVLSSGTRGDQR